MQNQNIENTNFIPAVIGGVLCFVLAVCSAGISLVLFFTLGLPGGSSGTYQFMLVASPIVFLLSIVGITYIPKLVFAKSKNPVGMRKRYNRILLLASPLVLLAILLFNIVSQGR